MVPVACGAIDREVRDLLGSTAAAPHVATLVATLPAAADLPTRAIAARVEHAVLALKRPLDALLADDLRSGALLFDWVHGAINDRLGAAFWDRPALRRFFASASGSIATRLAALAIPDEIDRPEQDPLFRVAFLAPGVATLDSLLGLARRGSVRACSYLLGTPRRLRRAEIGLLAGVFRERLAGLPPADLDRYDLPEFLAQISFPQERNAFLVAREFLRTATADEFATWRCLLTRHDDGMPAPTGDCEPAIAPTSFQILDRLQITDETLRAYLLGCPDLNEGLAAVHELSRDVPAAAVDHLLTLTQGRIRALATVAVLMPWFDTSDVFRFRSIVDLARHGRSAFLAAARDRIAEAASRAALLAVPDAAANRAPSVDRRVTDALRILLEADAPHGAVMFLPALADPRFLAAIAGHLDHLMLLPATRPVDFAGGRTIRFARKSSPSSWTAGDQVRCCLRFGAEHQRDSFERLDCALLVIEEGQRVVGMSRVWLGLDRRTLVLNSVELAAPIRAEAAGVRSALRSFLVDYLAGSVEAALPGARQPAIRRVHLGDAGDVDGADLDRGEIVVPLGDSAENRGRWSAGQNDCDLVQRVFLRV